MAWAALAASLAMLAFMARSLVTGQISFTGDLLHFHYPLRDFYARQLAAGQPFDWMPGLFAGFYVVGEGQLGGYHPLHWLLYRTLPLDRAFAVELVLAYPLLFAGTWLWLRRRCGAGPAAFGAMTATFCGFTLVHGVHPNMVGVLAHVPWLLWVLDAVAERHVPGTAWRPDPRGTGLIGLLIGLQFLLGHPQSVWFSGLICAAYTAHVITADRPAALDCCEDPGRRRGTGPCCRVSASAGHLGRGGAVEPSGVRRGLRHPVLPATRCIYCICFTRISSGDAGRGGTRRHWSATSSACTPAA